MLLQRRIRTRDDNKFGELIYRVIFDAGSAKTRDLQCLDVKTGEGVKVKVLIDDIVETRTG